MESDKMDQLIEKYFDGNTSIAEENELKDYFSSQNVAPHLQKYQPLFGFFAVEKQHKPNYSTSFGKNKTNRTWIGVAASVVILLGVSTFTYLNQTGEQTNDLGTFDDPEIALQETQKALLLLSSHVNTGVESVQFIEQYDEAKDKVFVR